eukprot:2750139-Rhodomonas_salina.2
MHLMVPTAELPKVTETWEEQVSLPVSASKATTGISTRQSSAEEPGAAEHTLLNAEPMLPPRLTPLPEEEQGVEEQSSGVSSTGESRAGGARADEPSAEELSTEGLHVEDQSHRNVIGGARAKIPCALS